MLTFVFNASRETSRDLANVSPKMAETQDFFLVSINEELSKLQEEKSPETQQLIQDAMNRIKVLEKEYESLKEDLTESGDDSRVIYAMISNFQNRIDILKNTLEHIHIIKQFKNQSHATNNTI
jgi:septal ring factor EnvC (AmiA/AmiB activator)